MGQGDQEQPVKASEQHKAHHDACVETYANLNLYFSDHWVDPDLLDQYRVGGVVVERRRVSVSHFAEGLAGNVRYTIASNLGRPAPPHQAIRNAECLLSKERFFKVIDSWHNDRLLQIVLIQMSEAAHQVLLGGLNDFDREIVNIARSNFQEQCHRPPLGVGRISGNQLRRVGSAPLGLYGELRPSSNGRKQVWWRGRVEFLYFHSESHQESLLWEPQFDFSHLRGAGLTVAKGRDSAPPPAQRGGQQPKQESASNPSSQPTTTTSTTTSTSSGPKTPRQRLTPERGYENPATELRMIRRRIRLRRWAIRWPILWVVGVAAQGLSVLLLPPSSHRNWILIALLGQLLAAAVIHYAATHSFNED